MTPPLSALSDDELQARMLRFGDRGMAADLRHDATDDPDDAIEARRCWDAVCALAQEVVRRGRVRRPAENDPRRHA
jgi:hypothetical protein